MQTKIKLPRQVLISNNCGLEFPVSWTKNLSHEHIVYIHDYDEIQTVYHDADFSRFDEMGCDWVTDAENWLFLFREDSVLERFRREVPNTHCDARVATAKDCAEYEL